MPTRGLKYPTITKVFSEMGFYPRLYGKNLSADKSQFKRVMHYYIESGIPVAVGVKVDEKTGHSIVCIGHGKINYGDIGKKIYAVYDTTMGNYIWIIDSADLCKNYITMDDGRIKQINICWEIINNEEFQVSLLKTDVLVIYNVLRLLKFVWVCEIYDHNLFQPEKIKKKV